MPVFRVLAEITPQEGACALGVLLRKDVALIG